MNTEHDLVRVAMSIARADTGVGGLVTMTGQTVPLVQFHQIGRVTLPIITVYVIVSRVAQGTPLSLFTDIQFDAWVEHGSEGLAYELLDRIEAILTTPAFKSYGLDVASDVRSRYALYFDQTEGRRRASMDMLFRLKR